MRKLLIVLVFGTIFQTSAFSQTNPDAKQTVANEEIKTFLIDKMQFTGNAADKVIVIENEFHNQLAVINSLGEIPVKEKEKKLNEAHVTRRTKLLEVPMTPRQMEDVVTLVESIRRKHKL